MTTIGEVIDRMRIEKGLSVSHLAVLSMLPPQSVWYIIKGGNPHLGTLEKIASGLGVNPVELFAEVIDAETSAPYSLEFVKSVFKNSVIAEDLKIDTDPTIDSEVESNPNGCTTRPRMTGAEAILSILERMNGEAPRRDDEGHSIVL